MDIAKCPDDTCPKKNACYRFNKQPTTYQSWANFGETRKGGDCEFYMTGYDNGTSKEY